MRWALRITAIPAATIAVALLMGSLPGLAADDSKRPYDVTENRPPCLNYTKLRQPFFGDLHVHTALSQDASTQGTRNMPRDAYRFARGERLGIQPYNEAGEPQRHLKLERPLDFAAVTDHAELLGEVEICRSPELSGYESIVCRIYRRWPRLAFFMMNSRATYVRDPDRYSFCGPNAVNCLEASRGPWKSIIEAAEGAYDRSAECAFTTFVAYEWTGGPGSNNIHRNVIFRNERVPNLPVSFFEASTRDTLWDELDRTCESTGTGCEAIIIPHNSNLSGGIMFETSRLDGTPVDAAGAERRSRREPLVEIIQHKGDSECLPGTGATDEMCAFEKLPYNNFRAKYVSVLADDPHPNSTVRYALGEGVRLQSTIGANPFQFGLIGSTDTHLGTPGAVNENVFLGHGGAGVPAMYEIPPGLPDNLEFNPGGLAVLWAEENTRDSLFAAMRRREAYATSGPRIVIRFFGGWDLSSNACNTPDLIASGYERGVPMGSVLPPSSTGSGPSFIVAASADQGTESTAGTPLERIQLVKGWVGADGKVKETVLDLAGEPRSEAPLLEESCSAVPEGQEALCTVWTDPSFDPQRPAYYYARILEVPTCRWSQKVCRSRGVDCANADTIGKGLKGCCSPEHRPTIRERAWTSPIWYTPEDPADVAQTH
jgi:hypothetical protein